MKNEYYLTARYTLDMIKVSKRVCYRTAEMLNLQVNTWQNHDRKPTITHHYVIINKNGKYTAKHR